jgi:hypothetical protein
MYNLLERELKRYSFRSDILRACIYPDRIINERGETVFLYTAKLQSVGMVSSFMSLRSDGNKTMLMRAEQTLKELMENLKTISTSLQLPDFQENDNQNMISFYSNPLLPDNVVVANPKTVYLMKLKLHQMFH